jgi:aryl-alcohol dehydrogenase-like predicted oxidoreductase
VAVLDHGISTGIANTRLTYSENTRQSSEKMLSPVAETTGTCVRRKTFRLDNGVPMEEINKGDEPMKYTQLGQTSLTVSKLCHGTWQFGGDWGSFEESLRNLAVDYIDLYQVHWPDPRTPFAETAEALEQTRPGREIRYVGMSNFDVVQMSNFEKTKKIETLQPPYHLFRRDIEQDILPSCQAHGIGVFVYGPLAHGLLGGRYTPLTTFASDDWRSKSPAFRGELFDRNLAVVARLKGLAERKAMTVAQLAIAWVLANPAVDVAIIGARHPKQLTDTAPTADVKLSQETLQEIATTMKNAAPTGGPSPEAM